MRPRLGTLWYNERARGRYPAPDDTSFLPHFCVSTAAKVLPDRSIEVNIDPTLKYAAITSVYSLVDTCIIFFFFPMLFFLNNHPNWARLYGRQTQTYYNPRHAPSIRCHLSLTPCTIRVILLRFRLVPFNIAAIWHKLIYLFLRVSAEAVFIHILVLVRLASHGKAKRALTLCRTLLKRITARFFGG